MRTRSLVVEAVGTLSGWALAPFFALTSAMRRARTFHPRGELFHAEVWTHDAVSEHDSDLARRLEGAAVVRLSDALAKHGPHWADVLGCAIRFGDDQDLLFATIKRPWTMPFAPLTTKTNDFLSNDYFAVTPFTIDHGERVWLRLRPEHPPRDATAVPPNATTADRRRARLATSIAAGEAVFVLAVSTGPRGPWRPISRIALERRVDDPPTFGFDPFLTGRGIRPRGFVHALRRGVYSASRRARNAHHAPAR